MAKQKLTIYLPEEIAIKLKVESAETGESNSDIVQETLTKRYKDKQEFEDNFPQTIEYYKKKEIKKR